MVGFESHLHHGPGSHGNVLDTVGFPENVGHAGTITSTVRALTFLFVTKGFCYVRVIPWLSWVGYTNEP